MNRTAIVTLAAAAVIGTTGGVMLAVSTVGSGDDDPTAGRSSDAGTTSSGDGRSPKDPADLVPLYYADGAIHDGATNVAVPTQVASGTISSLAEVEGGWLVVNVDSDTSGDPFYTGTFVPESGESWRIGEWRGRPDITAERDAVVYSNGVTWRIATFADRTTEPLDVIDGPGEDPSYVDIVNGLPGVAIGADGLITSWTAGDSTRLVVTEQDGWTHQDWGPRGVDVPLTSPDGAQAVAAYRNEDYAPENPVGDCLTGGPSDDTGSWWKECEVGPASLEPWSPSGERLLLTGTTGDGPGPSWVRVVDPATGEKLGEVDPTGLLAGATWADDTTVFTLTLDDETLAATIKRCDTRAERCEDVKRVPDTAVLGTRG